MARFEIPLSPTPQTFGITLAGVDYRLTVRFRNNVLAGWVLDIADVNSVPIVSGIPLITGADLLAQYAYLGIGGSLTVATDFSPDAVPTFSSLGIASHVIFTTS